MANALVVKETYLPSSRKSRRAAQYVRMSTDYQRYSIENQAAAIAAYAQAHDLSIIRTYRDEGESGLKLKNRPGLIQLLDDVRSDHADFDHVLVYDVSRWGRFQDIDEGAHHESQAGAQHYPSDGETGAVLVTRGAVNCAKCTECDGADAGANQASAQPVSLGCLRREVQADTIVGA